MEVLCWLLFGCMPEDKHMLELDMTQSHTRACSGQVDATAGEYCPLWHRQQVIVIHPSSTVVAVLDVTQSPVEDTSPLRAAARLNTGRILVTFWLRNLFEDPCLRAFENQTRVIGWPGYVHDVKLGETNLGGAGGELAGVAALAGLLWRPVPMPVPSGPLPRASK